MARQRRTYTSEFKVEAVKLVTEQGYSVAEAARSLDIGETLLRSWKTAFQVQGDQAFPGNGRRPAVEEELRRLRAEVEGLQKHHVPPADREETEEKSPDRETE